MKVILTGGTGFIGRAVSEALAQKGHEVIILTRQPSKSEEPGIRLHHRYWNPPEPDHGQNEIDGAGAVINLAGEPVVAKRWTRKQKLKILESRCDATQALAHAIQKAKSRPQVLINASAVGYYGPRDDGAVTEQEAPGNDFLAHVCKAWEAHAIRVEDFGVRAVRLRIGVVLAKGGGALAKMIPPFRLFLGGPLGNGRQWMSWIHREDVVGLILFSLANAKVRGALNAASPNPVTMKEFAETLGKVMHRPSAATVPAFVLKILLGEMADMLLTGQKVIPAKALDLGYQFRYPVLQQALEAILR